MKVEEDIVCQILGKPKLKRFVEVEIDGEKRWMLFSEETYQNILKRKK